MIDLDVRRNFFAGHGTGRDGTGFIIKISCGTGRDGFLMQRDGTGQKKRRPAGLWNINKLK
jgi:ribosomal protein S6E (S10)